MFHKFLYIDGELVVISTVTIKFCFSVFDELANYDTQRNSKDYTCVHVHIY
jgi:hypothetical protein